MPPVSPWERRLEAALVVSFLGAAATLASFESSSGLAAKLRDGRPVTALLTLRGETGAANLLGVYRPVTRSLDLVDLGPRGPASLGADGALVPPDLELSVETAGEAPSDALSAKRWLARWPRGALFWAAAARAYRRQGPPEGLSPYEAALLACELYRLPPSAVRPVWLPAAAHRRALLDSVLRDAPPAALPSQLRVEVLNASGENGVALNATKELRSELVDVIDYGNAAAAEPHTRLVDRAGRPKDALRVAELMGCPDAEVWTQYEPQAAAPVALVLGRDFRRCRRL